MTSKPSQKELAAATAALKARMTKFVLRDVGTVDARTMTVLQHSGVIRKPKPIESPDISKQLLQNDDEPGRVPAPWGPYLFLQEQETKRHVLNVANMLFISDVELRKATLEYFRGAESRGMLTQRTLSVIREQEPSLLSKRREVWQAAAVNIFDRLKDDWLMNLAGLRQGVAMGFDEGYSNCLHKVLRPTLGALEGMEPPMWSALDNRAVVEERISQIIETAETLPDLLDSYLSYCGFLPLAGALAMPAVVKKWLTNKPAPAHLWQVIWQWAADAGTPLADYHACAIFVALPSYLPADLIPQLWKEIAAITDITLKGDANYPTTEAWRLRCELSKHYAHYLEPLVPGQKGERIATLAWWLAEQVAQVFGTSNEVIARARRDATSQAYGLSSAVWKLVTSPIEPSPLRFATLFVNSVWSLGMLTQLADALPALRPDLMSVFDRGHIEDALTASALFFFPPYPFEGELTYAFDRGVQPTLAAWLSLLEGGKTDLLKTVTSVNQTLLADNNSANLLDRMGEGNEADDVVIGQRIRVLAHLGKAPVEQIWQRLSNPAWRDTKLQKGREVSLELLIDALLQIEVLGDDKWRSHLPHFFAMTAEAMPRNRDRQQLVFAATLLASAAGDTVSAFQRLLHGERRHEYLEDVRMWRERLDELIPLTSGWAAARLRSVRAALYVQ